ncbi:MAG TPA: hypothetical protein PK293_13715 [Spirochaetota bacterium]|nr:hypothetical protein [Spirochaetota bacterium]
MKIKIIIFAAIVVLTVSKAFALEFIVRGSADEMYDSNINAATEDPESDWITNLMLGAEIKSEGRSREFRLTGNAYYEYYANNKENSESYQDAGLSINKDIIDTVNFRLSDTFQHYPESKDFGTLFGRTDDDTGYISNDLSAGLSVFLTRKFFFELVYNNGIVNNDSGELEDSVSHEGGGDLGYYFNSANIVRAGYLYSRMKYDDGSVTRGDRGYAEYERFLTKQLRAILQGGYDYIDNAEGQSMNSRWEVSLVDDLDEINQVNITYLKESTISNITNDTLNNWQISAGLKREISGRLGVNISLFYGEGTYEVSRVTEKLGGASLALAFLVSDFINFNMGYRYTWNSSEAPDTDESSYDRNQVYVGISGEY